MVGREMLPALAMTVVQVGYAGMTITSKLAMDSGMNPFVLVAYRQIFATIILAPFAYFFERKTMPKITKPILFQLVLCSILGATLNQCLYFMGLKYSTPTITSALNNLLPAITFVMAILFRMETVGMRKVTGQAKVMGTIICVGGAMLMSFYQGKLINLGKSGIHWRYAQEMGKNNSTSGGGSSFLGPLFVALSCIAWSGWFIVQTKMGEKFAAPYTSTTIMCFLASIECTLIGVVFEHDIKEWSLASNIRIIAPLYAGAIGSALAFVLMSWCISRRGPLYVSMFNPLLLIIVAVVGWAILDEKVYVGSAVGSILIIAGLYVVLWGKAKEEENKIISFDEKDEKTNVGDEMGCDEERGDIEMPKVCTK